MKLTLALGVMAIALGTVTPLATPAEAQTNGRRTKGRRKPRRPLIDREEVHAALVTLGHEPSDYALEGSAASLAGRGRAKTDLVFKLSEAFGGDDTMAGLDGADDIISLNSSNLDIFAGLGNDEVTVSGGDLVAIFCAGAYGLTASPQAFLSQHRAGEIIINPAP